jgi:hypothetical protein
VSPVRYELGYIPEDGILHSHRHGNSNLLALTGWTLYRRRNVSPVKYELGLYIPEDGRENLKSYTDIHSVAQNKFTRPGFSFSSNSLGWGWG